RRIRAPRRRTPERIFRRMAARPAAQSFPTGGGMFMPAGGLPVYKYKLEGSLDGKEFFMLVDQTNNTKIADCTFDDIAPKQCRYVRLTITGWPEGINLGIIEATVFGRYSGYMLPTNPQENDRYLYNY
ncbi:MAG: discoidin domain-containing protein, partial [Bacteroidales bacterium]|nr:discoidin domain-containing protein [Bacteroidales bacterium]